MDRKAIEKANKLEERIISLNNKVIEFRPQHCNGVGVSKKIYSPSSNNHSIDYKYNLWSTSKHEPTDDNTKIMMAGLEAMHKKAEELLSEAKENLDDL